MKLTFAAIGFVCLASSSSAAPPDELREALVRLEERAGSANNPLDDADLAGGALRIALQHIRSGGAAAERMRRLQEVRAVVDPYVTVLLHFAKPTNDSQGNPNALRCLYYASPTEGLRDGLLDVAKTENPRGAAADAYSILIAHDLMTEELRRELGARITGYTNEMETPAAAELLYRSKHWGQPELVQAYDALLSRRFRSEAELNSVVRAVAEAVQRIGVPAATLLPALRQHTARMR
ncbi:MAG: hypothetical protein ACR2OZ_14235 [Verrucomicrobiales bacterium]